MAAALLILLLGACVAPLASAGQVRLGAGDPVGEILFSATLQRERVLHDPRAYLAAQGQEKQAEGPRTYEIYIHGVDNDEFDRVNSDLNDASVILRVERRGFHRGILQFEVLSRADQQALITAIRAKRYELVDEDPGRIGFRLSTR